MLKMMIMKNIWLDLSVELDSQQDRDDVSIVWWNVCTRPIRYLWKMVARSLEYYMYDREYAFHPPKE